MGKRYFSGKRSNADWRELESDEAKQQRGGGWMLFSHQLIAQRGMKCEHCGVTQQELWANRKSGLHVHHKAKIKLARELRFDPENCEVLCQPCHNKAEKLATGPSRFSKRWPIKSFKETPLFDETLVKPITKTTDEESEEATNDVA